MKTNFDFLTDEEIFSNATPKTFSEEQLLNLMLEKLGEIATIQEVCEFLKVSETHIYKAMEERKIIVFKTGKKNLIFTKSLLNIIRERAN